MNNCTFPKYFVEGLALTNDGRLVVSSGQYGKSSLAQLTFDLNACQFKEINNQPLDTSKFGEGIAVVDDTLY